MIDFIHEIQSLKTHKKGQVISLHKPLLLLLTISEIIQGHTNQFRYDEIEGILTDLLRKYGLKNTKKVSPQYPFIYLASNERIWNCSVRKEDLKTPDAASRSELLGASGQFTDAFYQYLLQGNNAMKVMQILLQTYWPEAYYEDILNDLGISNVSATESVAAFKNANIRSRQFVEDVMDAYERKCAICGQSIRLGDNLIGIDACHLKPLQHNGDDSVNNGLALCKTHHWALDRGAISITEERSIVVSKKLNGQKSDEAFFKYDHQSIHIPRDRENWLEDENIRYHLKYIFVK